MIDAALRTRAPMHALRNERFAAFVDVDHGAELVRLLDLRRGRDVLGRPPFPAGSPTSGPHDEPSWTAEYRGGWQLCAPNYGQSCVQDGRRHSFHGDASTQPWEQLDGTQEHVTARWSGHGISLERTLSLIDDGVQATTTARSTVQRPVPLCVVEHVALGVDVLHPGFDLTLPSAVAYEIDDIAGPPRAPSGATRWPEVLGLDGSRRTARTFTGTGSWSHLDVLRDVHAGHARVRNRATGMTVDLRWSGEALRHMIVWNEHHGLGGIWRHATELLCLEPSSVPHGMGLARAAAGGDAVWLAPEQATSWTVTLATGDDPTGAP